MRTALFALVLTVMVGANPSARAEDYKIDDSHSAFTFKISHLGLLPQGQPERARRALRMVAQYNRELFGSCTNIGECEAVCPKEIRLEVISRMNRDYLRAAWKDRSALREDKPIEEPRAGGRR